MPHPLETKLDESFHRRPPARRRSSLDNSNLSAEGAVKERLASTSNLHGDEKNHYQKRRPSLSNGLSIPITFLANPNGITRPKADLDVDLHTSSHSRRKGSSSLQVPRESLLQRTSTQGSSNTVSDDELEFELTVPGKLKTTRNHPHGEDSDASSSVSSSFSEDDDDGGNSFCDASVLEQADEDYIKSDLGASCFWSDGPDDLADVDFQIDDSELQRNLVEIIAEEGLEEGMEAADAAALAEALQAMRS